MKKKAKGLPPPTVRRVKLGRTTFIIYDFTRTLEAWAKIPIEPAPLTALLMAMMEKRR